MYLRENSVADRYGASSGGAIARNAVPLRLLYTQDDLNVPCEHAKAFPNAPLIEAPRRQYASAFAWLLHPRLPRPPRSIEPHVLFAGFSLNA